MGQPAEDEHIGQRLDRYLAGQLSEAEELEVETHLLRCRRCRVEADEASRSAPPPPIANTAPGRCTGSPGRPQPPVRGR